MTQSTVGHHESMASVPPSTQSASILARLDRIPVWSLPWSYLVIIGIGYFFTFFDIADIGYGMPAIAKQFHLSGSTSTFVALSIGLIGYAVGSLVIGTLSDRFGRYRILLFTIGLTAVGSFLDATATGVVTLSIWRFVTGMGVGADLNLVSTYVGELAPASQRGRISNLTFLVGILGQAVTPFVALGLVPNFTYGWRLLFVIGGVIAAVGLLGRFQLPESPRWLATHGRAEEAEAIVVRMEDTARGRGIDLPEPHVDDEVTAELQGFPARALLRPVFARRLAVLIPMWFLWYIGNYGFLGDSADLLSTRGYDIANSILYLGVGGLGYPVGALIMAWLSDRKERKVLMFGSSVVWLVGLILVGTLANEGVLVRRSSPLWASGCGCRWPTPTPPSASRRRPARPGSPCPTGWATPAGRSGAWPCRTWWRGRRSSPASRGSGSPG